MTLRELYRVWIRQKSREVGPSTTAKYMQDCTHHILPALGDRGVEGITKRDVRDFLYGRLDAGMGRKTVADIAVILKMMMRFGGEELGLSVCTDFGRLPTRGEAAPKIMRYSPSDFRRITSYCVSHPSSGSLGILITCCTGLRIGEICALKWGDVDLDRKVISVSRTIERIGDFDGDGEYLHRTVVIEKAPKTACSRREVPIMRDIFPIVRNFSKVALPGYYVCTGGPAPTEPRTYRVYYRKLVRLAGVSPVLKFHALRHTFATTMIEGGADVKTVSMILGHSNIGITMDTYVHPSEEQRMKSVNAALKGFFR